MAKALSEAHRAAISAGLKGKAKSAEHRAKLSAAKMGKAPSDEARSAMSRAGRGKPKSAAHRAAISAALRGMPKERGGVTYFNTHGDMGRADAHQCKCGNQARDWAYQYTAGENELLSPEGWPFSTNPDDYIPMCRSCHRKFDNQRRKMEQNK